MFPLSLIRMLSWWRLVFLAQFELTRLWQPAKITSLPWCGQASSVKDLPSSKGSRSRTLAKYGDEPVAPHLHQTLFYQYLFSLHSQTPRFEKSSRILTENKHDYGSLRRNKNKSKSEKKSKSKTTSTTSTICTTTSTSTTTTTYQIFESRQTRRLNNTNKLHTSKRRKHSTQKDELNKQNRHLPQTIANKAKQQWLWNVMSWHSQAVKAVPFVICTSSHLSSSLDQKAEIWNTKKCIDNKQHEVSVCKKHLCDIPHQVYASKRQMDQTWQIYTNLIKSQLIMKHQELHVEIPRRRVFGSADLDGLSSPSSKPGCLRCYKTMTAAKCGQVPSKQTCVSYV